MKSVKRKKALNKLIIALLIIVLGMGVLANTTHAVTDTDGGGNIFDPIMKFITFLCDSVMQFMQNTFTSNQSISNNDGTYTYQYSPAIIFSGTVKGLDINFIKPNNEFVVIKNYDAWVKPKSDEYLKSVEAIELSEYNTKYNNAKAHKDARIVFKREGKLPNKSTTAEIIYYEDNNRLYVDVFYKETIAYNDVSNQGTVKVALSYIYKCYYKGYSYEIEDVLSEIDPSSEYTSIAYELQPTIATWYNALRRIALVGLLSVLLYVGIRILITSVAGKENSKYKKMLIDWLTALCLLFTLHYIMSLTLVVTNEVSDIFNIGNEDALLGDIRHKIDKGASSWGAALTQVVMYVVLTIYTVTFTFQYLKRVLYMAFFTMIAPLITLTYPLDKISDGKAQAFSMWLKEYIFTALIQVVHLIVYYTMVGSASALVDLYPIYALVAIGFIVPAEKIIRSMFGFNNADTVGTMGAVATGALASKAMNGLKSLPKIPKGGKDGAGKGESKNNIRTATNTDVLSTVRNGGSTSAQRQQQTQQQTQQQAQQQTQPQTQQQNQQQAQHQTSQTTNQKPKLGGAARSLLGKYHRKVGGAALGVLTGGTGAMIGFAAGVAQGDLGAAIGGAWAGSKAGYNLGGRAYNGAFNIPGSIRTTLNNIGDTYNEGAYGEEYANNVKFDREFRRSSTYKALKQKYGNNFSDEYVQSMLEAGITEQKAMDKILKNVTGQNGYSIEDAMGYYALKKQCKDAGVYYDDNKLRQWLEDNGFGQINDLTQIKDHLKNF